MFELILYEPEIPPNTGNVMRLAVNSGARLHLIEPLGFSLDDRLLRRAGLDYREWADVRVHQSLGTCLDALQQPRLFGVSTRGARCYTRVSYQAGDAFVFGPETRGLPDAVLQGLPEQQRLFLPMRPGNRSLNLANTVAVLAYEAWRQLGFQGAQGRPVEP
ncbi:tRNA (cytidine(34)-2'-O)-methyltransferase [Thiorhodococcus minor]|uniref:tRNA (cytidine(34)-2'-O)-methyltransferase n=1 Tax=Thiorhodococcus minor TaxID=57489 RepID=A0A6M0K0X7_9GAMM|nr:tRNA (cytidine(34)-2'-O)-methyltransferase [Thiorhodococcus minor]NEV63426.1 tRNA (cytidine(34)-2'-O)-methyltransferase [Thiorhodococcus minor]